MSIDRSLLAAATFLSVLAPALGLAQTPAELATRRDLITRAQREHQDGHHEAALELASRAGDIQWSASLRQLVANEQMETGRLADAYGNAEICAREARDPTQTVTDRPLVLHNCEQLQQRLQARVGHLTVRTPASPPADLAITVAGQSLRSTLWNISTFVNPTTIEVTATATGFETFRQTLTVAEGASVEVTLELRPATAATSQDAGTTSDTNGSPGSVAGPAVVIAVGGASLISSAILFGVWSMGSSAFEHAYCSPPEYLSCNNTDQVRADLGSLQGLNTGAWVTLGVGVAAVAAGAIWFGVSRGGSSPARRTQVEVRPVVGVGTFGLVGSW